MHKSLTNPEDTTKSLATHVMDALGGGVEADAFWGWDTRVSPNWCRSRWWVWYPCGIRFWVNRNVMDTILNSSAGAVYGRLFVWLSPICSWSLIVGAIGTGWCMTLVGAATGAFVWGSRNWISQNRWWCNSGLAVNMNFSQGWDVHCNNKY